MASLSTEYSKTSTKGPSKKQTTSLQRMAHLPQLDFTIELIHFEPPRSGHLTLSCALSLVVCETDFASTHTALQHYSQENSNLVIGIWCSCRRSRERVVSWSISLSCQKPQLEPVPYNQHFEPAPTSTARVLNAVSVPPHGERTCFGHTVYTG